MYFSFIPLRYNNLKRSKCWFVSNPFIKKPCDLNARTVSRNQFYTPDIVSGESSIYKWHRDRIMHTLFKE